MYNINRGEWGVKWRIIIFMSEDKGRSVVYDSGNREKENWFGRLTGFDDWFYVGCE